jgi:molybdopterin/thiamine biosynthesis adenylyltransferase
VVARRTLLSPEEVAVYEWQLSVPGFGSEGQAALKGASALVSRIGGVGGSAAYFLAAAGIGRLVIAHRGNVRASDLNRQILMTQDWIGKPRVESAARRLRDLNPRVVVETVAENVTEENVDALARDVDLLVDCAPLFKERFLMNQAAVRHKKPMVDCAMYELEGQVTTIVPGRTPCLACLYPADPPGWHRKFPVFGAVAGTIGGLAAIEAIKVLSGMGEPLLGRLLTCDLRDMAFRIVRLNRRPNCRVCGSKKARTGG